VPELVYYEYTEADVLTPEKEVALTAPVTPEITALQQNELIVAVRNRLLAAFTATATAPHRKIYVSRAQQKTRRLANEGAILPILEKHGFELVYFETLSFGEQLRLMQETRVFAGVHGANMVNLLFLQPGAQVVELMNKDYVNDAYYLLASSIKLPYYAVPCCMADGTIDATADRVVLNDADLLVAPADLEQTLALLPR
jgi:capsular polysaccharide biosynthesis protein